MVPHALMWRITPAYAGRILTNYKRLSQGKDHPRIRGKNLTYRTSSGYTLGSPPHTREELILNIKISSNNRITPAYAGRILNYKAYNKIK